MKRVFKYGLITLGVFGFILLAFVLFYEKTLVVPTDSMEPTIRVGDTVKLRYAWIHRELERFALVGYFPSEEREMIFVHRIIGLPGEIVKLSDSIGPVRIKAGNGEN